MRDEEGLGRLYRAGVIDPATGRDFSIEKAMILETETPSISPEWYYLIITPLSATDMGHYVKYRRMNNMSRCGN